MAIQKNVIRTARIAAGVVTGAAAAIGGGVMAARQKAATKPKVVTDTTEDGRHVRILKVGGGFQSITYVHEDHRFETAVEYYRTFDMLLDFGLDVTRILALGAGGCAWPKHVSFDHPEIVVDAVEADPEIVEIAHKHFYIDELPQECQFTLHQCDALDFLLRCREEGTRYSLMVNDCYNAKKFDDGTLSPETLSLCKQCLEEGGLYAVNVVSTRNGRGLRNVKKATKALRVAFKHVYAFPSPDPDFGGEDNYVLVATDGEYRLDGMPKGE